MVVPHSHRALTKEGDPASAITVHLLKTDPINATPRILCLVRHKSRYATFQAQVYRGNILKMRNKTIPKRETTTSTATIGITLYLRILLVVESKSDEKTFFQSNIKNSCFIRSIVDAHDRESES